MNKRAATRTAGYATCGGSLDAFSTPSSSEPARQRLLVAGLELFAEHGYAKTSIRRIALAAETNVASVSYYFGNKAGLYRAIFWGEPGLGMRSADAPGAQRCTASLDEIFRAILEPLKSGDRARAWIRLHRREMLEPTGLWQEKVDRGMQPTHAAVVAQLCARLGLAKPDDEVEALATLILAPAIHLLVNCEVIDVIAPRLLADSAAVDAWHARLMRSAEALTRAEAERRQHRARRSVDANAARTMVRQPRQATILDRQPRSRA